MIAEQSRWVRGTMFQQ